MKKFTFLFVVAMFTMGISLSAQKKEKILKDEKRTTVAGKRGAVIKNDVPTKDVEAPAPGKQESRGYGDCSLGFSNYTGYWVKAYVDGNFMGYIEPYGFETYYAYDGYTSWYCETAGGTYSWSDSGNCEGYYEYNLR